jgi:hypothetical protein
MTGVVGRESEKFESKVLEEEVEDLTRSQAVTPVDVRMELER